MKKSFSALAGVAALAAVLLLTDCHRDVAEVASDNPLVGKSCTVQFRRDVIGLVGGTPGSPSETTVNGVDTTLKGTLRSTHGEWVVIENKGQEVWIPKSVILAIRF